MSASSEQFDRPWGNTASVLHFRRQIIVLSSVSAAAPRTTVVLTETRCDHVGSQCQDHSSAYKPLHSYKLTTYFLRSGVKKKVNYFSVPDIM